MPIGMTGGIRRWVAARDRRRLAGWQAVLGRAAAADPAALRRIRAEARELRRAADQVLADTDARLAALAPCPPQQGGADWIARAPMWCGAATPAGQVAGGPRTALGTGLALFHDGALAEIIATQVPTLRETDPAAFALRVEVFGFDGSFVSLAADLPPEGLTGLGRGQVLALWLDLAAEQGVPEVYLRLNLVHGPNVARLTRRLPATSGPVQADFDLSEADFAPERLERAWVDLILGEPRMTALTIRDLGFSRRRRAEL